MSRLPQISPEQATSQQAELFDAVSAKLGRVPNLMRALANSPAALRGYLEFSGALAAGDGLTAQQREVVALAIAEANGCEYCLAAHSAIGKMVGLSPEAIKSARRAEGVDDQANALARFAASVLHARGRISQAELDAFVTAGFSNAAVVEVVAHVALNVYTNYFNNLVETEVDFPAAAPRPTEPNEELACSTSCGCDA